MFTPISKVLFAAALLAANAGAQIGASPKQASPEIYQLMRQESRQSVPATQRLEFKKLHDADIKLEAADAAMLRLILTNSRQFSELERFVSGLDTTVDTRRLLMIHTADIEGLQRAQKVSDEDRKASSDRQQAILIGTIMLLIGAIVRWLFESRRRATAEVEFAKAAEGRDAALIAQVIAHLDAVKVR